MAIRLNSEKTIDTENFKLKIGTTDKLEPKVIYFEGKTFISPNEEKETYDKDIYEIKYKLKNFISNNIKNLESFDNKFILVFDVASSGISINKKSFLSFQFLLKQQNINKLKALNEIKTETNDFIHGVIGNLETSIKDHNFSISKSKRA